MKHASPETLATLGDLLAALRGIDGLTEKRPGASRAGSRAFLHFHEDPTGTYADARFDSDFERVRVTTKRERRVFIARVRTELARAAK